MFLAEFSLEKNTKDKIAIFSGRFHPFHRGHYAVYTYLVKLFGQNSVFIATSDKQNSDDSPFSFEEKKKIISFAGVPEENIIMVKSPYKASEITDEYNPDKTVVIYAVSRKDMESNPRFKSWKTKSGSPTYFQPYSKKENQLGFKHHSYVITVPTFNFTILNKTVKSATELRNLFSNSNINTQKEIIKQMYGKYDRSIHALLHSKLKNSEAVT